MLASRFRLGRSAELHHVLRRGRVARVKGFGIKSLPSKLPSARFAISISNKAHKRATKRNQVRRQIAGIIMEHKDDIGGGKDCAIAVYHEAFALSKADRREQILELLKKARLLQ